MKITRILPRVLRTIQKRFQTPLKLAELRRHSALVPLANALERTLWSTFSAEERAWIERIEAARAELEGSTQLVALEGSAPGSMVFGRVVEIRANERFFTRSIREIVKRSTKPAGQARLLFHLVRQFEPQNCLELGTCVGMSAAYQAAALELNGRGHLTTIEGHAALAKFAQQHLERLGLRRVAVKQGRFREVLQGVLDDLASLDYVFVDGDHEEEPTLRYFNQLIPLASDAGVIVFDDVAWSPGMRNAWKKIVADERIRLSVDLGSMGICMRGGTLDKQHVRIVL